ncbi:mechanosensitive ion channel family protein [Pedobacter endophyticus]|uniref:Mechanosensitive ion channel n=1 Tax=Pedobacter endophyticus TaxID=2789740 RepID=A0A7S9KYB5_9SPHI|nr:mechanosensitive ion channel domain-containing protein [Pedobacter endophyticus]QPH39072.1 mechanosensitive ion channel [Pedobacter endophyticus]
MNLTSFKKRCVFAALIIAALQLPFPVFSQQKTDSLTLKSGKINESQIPLLVSKVESYNFTIDRSKFLLQRGYDIKKIEHALPAIEKQIKSIKSKFDYKNNRLNLRTLNSGVIILNEVTDHLMAYQTLLSGYYDQLSKSSGTLHGILTDVTLKGKVQDATLRSQLADVLLEGKKLDTAQKHILRRITLLSSHVSVNLLQAKNLSSDMVYLSISKKIDMWSQEEAPLFKAKSNQYENAFSEVILKAFDRSWKIIVIYLGGKIGISVLSILIFAILTGWMLSNMRRVKQLKNSRSILSQLKFLKRGVVLASVFAFFTYIPFLFGNPTMSLQHAIELCRLIALCFVLNPFLTKPGKLVLYGLSVLWVYYALDDILLDSAFAERWILFAAACLLLFLCIKILRNKDKLFSRIEPSPATTALLVFTIFQVVLSMVFNLTGRLSLAKIFGVSAVQCLVLGLSLKVFCALVLEAVYLQTEAYQSSRFSDFINYKGIKSRLQGYLWVFAIVVFFVSLMRNITLYDFLVNAISQFFYQTRTLGTYEFTFFSIGIFIGILWLSSVISSFISFFFSQEAGVAGSSRNSLNSMMLIIRLAIWTVGFIIAVAAAGIPIDKLSIMLGALGVGIGFGLQNIVNNLVSGIIIAFERPIQIGDQIEIGTKAGVVKEIGVRSSKIHSAEGADIIVPNGDLLSQHLINWTMQDRSKRVEFTIGAAYETDIENARELIADKLAENERILQLPEPAIIVQDFGEYAIGIRTMFWVADLSVAGEVRTEAMIEVKKTLTEAGIKLQVRPL